MFAKRRSFLAYALALATLPAMARTGGDELAAVMDHWASGYGSLDLPTLALSYETFLADVLDAADREAQEKFFAGVVSRLERIDATELNVEETLEHAILRYESELQLEQLALAGAWPAGRPINDAGIHHQHDGRRWYRYLVRLWTSAAASPDEIAAYGREEIARIKATMASLGPDLEAAGETRSERRIEAAFDAYANGISATLDRHFPAFPDLPPLSVARGTNAALAQVPGYYGNDRLAYNLFDTPFDLDQIPWLYIHEGNPGHHFQLNYETTREVPAYRSGLNYSGFREGWAAYVEAVGHEIGLYPTDAARLKQLEWDLIRSTRLVLDVGINDRGWTDAAALAEWRRHIVGLDAIGRREIERMRRWPAQVLTYKLGAKAILEARTHASERTLQEFHTVLLSERSIPVLLVGELLRGGR
ncbi:MAG: DUF885 family protein [Pseudomonadota bacterium]